MLELLVAQYDAKRTERLAQDKVAATLASEEAALKQQLINALNDQNLTVAGNSSVFFTLRKKTRYQAADWEQIHQYIVENDAWDLMHRRLSDAAIEERLPNGAIPGVASYEFDDLSRPQKVK